MRFDYGDAVKITADAPIKYLKFGAFGSICGVDESVQNERSKEFNVGQGTPIYLVEFATGQAIEVPEIYLKPQ